MKSEYENVNFVEDDVFIYAMKNGIVEEVIGKKSQIPPQYLNLLVGAKVMYDTISNTTQSMERMLTALEAEVPTLAPAGKKGIESLIVFFRNVQEQNMLAMRAAEIGLAAIGKEMVAEAFTKKKF